MTLMVARVYFYIPALLFLLLSLTLILKPPIALRVLFLIPVMFDGGIIEHFVITSGPPPCHPERSVSVVEGSDCLRQSLSARQPSPFCGYTFIYPRCFFAALALPDASTTLSMTNSRLPRPRHSPLHSTPPPALAGI